MFVEAPAAPSRVDDRALFNARHLRVDRGARDDDEAEERVDAVSAFARPGGLCFRSLSLSLTLNTSSLACLFACLLGAGSVALQQLWCDGCPVVLPCSG